MANKITDLTVYNTPTTDDPDGTLKDQEYSAPGVVSVVGSRAYGRFITDLLSPFHRMINKWISGGLNGTTDKQLDSQFFDGLLTQINRTAQASAFQASLKSWDVDNLTNGPSSGNYDCLAYGDNKWVLIWFTGSAIEAAVFDGNSNDTTNTVVTSASYAPTSLYYDGTNFILLIDGTAGTVDRVFTSPDGVTWTARIFSASATADLYVVGKIGSTLIAPAYNQANDRVMTSTDNGVTWTANDAGTPVGGYKPRALASNGTTLIWADEAQNLIRYTTDGTTWANATISGGTLNGSFNAVWDGERFLVFDKSASKYFISDPAASPAHSTFTEKTFPFSEAFHLHTACVFRGITYVIGNDSNKQYCTNPDGANNAIWDAYDSYPGSSAPASNNQLVAVGDRKILISGESGQPKRVYMTLPLFDANPD
jgi:hypothetical protein